MNALLPGITTRREIHPAAPAEKAEVSVAEALRRAEHTKERIELRECSTELSNAVRRLETLRARMAKEGGAL